MKITIDKILIVLIYNVLFVFAKNVPPSLKLVQRASDPPKECKNVNEEYQCGSACQNRCSTLGVPCLIVNIRCNDDCYCIAGYARDSKGKCIPESSCSNTQVSLFK